MSTPLHLRAAATPLACAHARARTHALSANFGNIQADEASPRRRARPAYRRLKSHEMATVPTTFATFVNVRHTNARGPCGPRAPCPLIGASCLDAATVVAADVEVGDPAAAVDAAVEPQLRKARVIGLLAIARLAVALLRVARLAVALLRVALVRIGLVGITRIGLAVLIVVLPVAAHAGVDQAGDAKAALAAVDAGDRHDLGAAVMLVVALVAVTRLAVALLAISLVPGAVDAAAVVLAHPDFGGAGALVDRHAVIALAIGAIAASAQHLVDDLADNALLLAVTLVVLGLRVILGGCRGCDGGDAHAGDADEKLRVDGHDISF